MYVYCGFKDRHENRCNQKMQTNPGIGYFIQLYTWIIYCNIIYTVIYLFL